MDTLDNICFENNFKPNFLKIDVEGAEYEVLEGAIKVLKSVNNIMIEITRNKNNVFNLLFKLEFKEIPLKEETSNYFFKKTNNY